MKKLNYLMLLLVFALHACDERHEPDTLQDDLTEIDPHFVETRDTFPLHGPTNITRHILQDKNGSFWFATYQGLINFNGKNFTNVTLNRSLRHNRVFCMLEDSKGIIWFGTIGAGVYKFDGKNFIHLTTREGLANDVVMSIFQDISGKIWFGTKGGASCYDGEKFTNFSTKGSKSNMILSMTQDTNKVIWLGTDSSLTCYNGKLMSEFLMNDNSGFTNVRTVTRDEFGKLWIGGSDGLFCYDGKQLIRWLPDLQCIGNVLHGKKGTFWVSGKEADLKDGTFKRHVNMCLFKYDNKSLVKIFEKDRCEVFCIIEDSSGNIWFGTTEGVYRYNGKTFDFI